MTTADLVHRVVPREALRGACAPGLEYLRANGHRPAAEVLGECLLTTQGCAFVRWVAVQAFGQRAVDAIDRGHRAACDACDHNPRAAGAVEWRAHTTREVADWLRAEIGGAS